MDIATSAQSLSVIRKFRSLGVIWGIFTICYNIIVWVVFTQDEWIGDRITGSLGQVPGQFGLYSWCVGSSCYGGLREVSRLSAPFFTAVTVITALSLLTSSLSIVSTFLFCKYSSSTVYKLCGSLQIISGVLLLATLLLYPVTWKHDDVKTVCGNNAGFYSLGNCEIRWAFILAIIATFDGFILGGLALALAFSEVRCREDFYRDLHTSDHLVYPTLDRTVNSYSNLGFNSDSLSIYGSKSGLYMTPHGHGEEDRYSAYSRGTVGSARHNYYNLVL